MALSEEEIDRAIKRVDDDWSLEEVHDALLQLRRERDEARAEGKNTYAELSNYITHNEQLKAWLRQAWKERDELIRLGRAMREHQQGSFLRWRNAGTGKILNTAEEQAFDDYIATLEPEKTE